jgi:hypothetical protein
MSPNCPIRYWDLFEEDGETPLTNSTELKILFQEESLLVSTETFDWN